MLYILLMCISIYVWAPRTLAAFPQSAVVCRTGRGATQAVAEMVARDAFDNAEVTALARPEVHVLHMIYIYIYIYMCIHI